MISGRGRQGLPMIPPKTMLVTLNDFLLYLVGLGHTIKDPLERI